MASYYYLVATLPTLRLDGPLSFSTDTFLGLCKPLVSEHHYRLLCKALSGEPSSHPFLKAYQHFASMVNKELVEQRSRKLSLSDPVYRNDGDKEGRISDAVRQALAQDNVLEAEMLLLALHWKFLDELATLHTFDIEALLGFALKLKLLQRKSLFTREEGNAEFKRLFSNIQTEIANN